MAPALRPDLRTSRGPTHGLAAALLAAVLLAWAGFAALAVRAAALPPEAAGTMVAVFSPTVSEAEVLTAVARADGLPVRPTWVRNAWVVHGPTPGFAGRLGAAGAWAALASMPFEPSGVLGGCPFVPRLEESVEVALPQAATLRR